MSVTIRRDPHRRRPDRTDSLGYKTLERGFVQAHTLYSYAPHVTDNSYDCTRNSVSARTRLVTQSPVLILLQVRIFRPVEFSARLTAMRSHFRFVFICPVQKAQKHNVSITYSGQDSETTMVLNIATADETCINNIIHYGMYTAQHGAPSTTTRCDKAKQR